MFYELLSARVTFLVGRMFQEMRRTAVSYWYPGSSMKYDVQSARGIICGEACVISWSNVSSNPTTLLHYSSVLTVKTTQT